MKKLKEWANKLKQQLAVLHLAYQDKRTPWYAKALIVLIIAYALSPIDLIPDFIPVLGYLDDVILLPAGIYLAIQLIPDEVMEDSRKKAKDYVWNKKQSWKTACIILLFWLLITFWIVQYLFIK